MIWVVLLNKDFRKHCFETQTNKFIRYERDPDAAGDWYSIGAGLASDEGTPTDYERAEWLRQDMLGYNYTQVHEIYQPKP